MQIRKPFWKRIYDTGKRTKLEIFTVLVVLCLMTATAVLSVKYFQIKNERDRFETMFREATCLESQNELRSQHGRKDASKNAAEHKTQRHAENDIDSNADKYANKNFSTEAGNQLEELEDMKLRLQREIESRIQCERDLQARKNADEDLKIKESRMEFMLQDLEQKETDFEQEKRNFEVYKNSAINDLQARKDADEDLKIKESRMEFMLQNLEQKEKDFEQEKRNFEVYKNAAINDLEVKKDQLSKSNGVKDGSSDDPESDWSEKRKHLKSLIEHKKPIKVLFIRHAESEWNEATEKSHVRKAQMHIASLLGFNKQYTDSPISGTGEFQAKLAARDLYKNVGSDAIIFSSPLRRAMETARLIFPDKEAVPEIFTSQFLRESSSQPDCVSTICDENNLDQDEIKKFKAQGFVFDASPRADILDQDVKSAFEVMIRKTLEKKKSKLVIVGHSTWARKGFCRVEEFTPMKKKLQNVQSASFVFDPSNHLEYDFWKRFSDIEIGDEVKPSSSSSHNLGDGEWITVDLK